MTEEEKKALVKEICEGLQETTEIGLNAIMNMVLDMLIKLETITDIPSRILFLNTIKDEINKKETN